MMKTIPHKMSAPELFRVIAARVNRQKWQLITLAVMIGLMFSASGRGALQTLMLVGKRLLPFILIYAAYRFLKYKIKVKIARSHPFVMRDRPSAQNSGPIIDLCPHCGSVRCTCR